MWAIRRASIPLKNRIFVTRISIAFSNNSDPPSSSSQDNNGNCDSAGGRNHARRSFYLDEFYIGRRCFSSETFAGAKISGVNGDDDMEEGFSELETPISNNDDDDAIIDQDDEDKSKVSDDHVTADVEEEPCENELELDTRTDMTEKEFMATEQASSGLFEAIVAAPMRSSVHDTIHKWIKEGNELGRKEYTLAMVHLRRRRMYGEALQLSEWLEKSEKFGMDEGDYASQLDLIAKVHGLYKAEQYIEKIPETFRGEAMYQTLLAGAVACKDRLKAEKILKEMIDSDFKLNTFVYNQLLLLYRRYDKKKLPDILLLMEKEGLKPNIFTYKILIDVKGYSNDIKGVDQIVETMKEEGTEPGIPVQATIARHYINAGEKEKAKVLLEKIESDCSGSKNFKKQRWSCRFLLPLYAALGETDDVQRLWKLYESNPGSDLPRAAIEAWGKLNKVEEAETVFSKLVETKNVRPKHYSALLKIYANHKMLMKGKELVYEMLNSGCPIDPSTLDALIKLYIEAGEIEKADSILHKAVDKNRMKPMYDTYMTIMEQYSQRGDIHNTEKIFYRMRQQAGYFPQLRQFQALISAYMNAKAPFYGARERMKADDIFPNRALAGQLAQVDAFRKTALTELLD